MKRTTFKVGRKEIIIALTLFVYLLMAGVVAVPMQDELSIRVEFSNVGGYRTDFDSQLYWNTGEGYSEENSHLAEVTRNRVLFAVDALAEEIVSLRLDPMNEAIAVKISSVWIMNHGLAVRNIPVRDILQYSHLVNIDSARIEKAALCFEAVNDDPMIELQADLVEEYLADANSRLRAIICKWLLLFYAVAVLAVRNSDTVKKILHIFGQNFDNIMRGLLLLAAALVCVMAFRSYDYAHPDENVSKGAVEYYMQHWTPADIRSPEAADSFSEYGFSRLSEKTVYYYLAGKVAWLGKNIFGLVKYYRLFNVCLFLALVGLCIKRGKTNRYLYMLVGMSPQIWYLYSYCTSDAWDYFLTVLIMYQVLNRDSVLNKALVESAYRWKVQSLLAVGSMFGLLYFGKSNYLAVFLIAFLTFAKRLFELPGEERLGLIRKYLAIVMVFAAWVMGMNLFTMAKYGPDYGEIQAQLRQAYAWDAYKVDENGQREYAGSELRGRGVTLQELFTEYKFGKSSVESYAGCYGWMEYPGSMGYYRVFYACYALIAVLWMAEMIKKRCHFGKYLFYIALNSVALVMFGVSAWHSWTSDFQAQGRYLMPVNGIYAINESEMPKDSICDRIVGLLQVLIVMMGMYSFIYYGICMLT